MQYQGHTRQRRDARALLVGGADWFAAQCFWPLWTLVLLLQALDVGSVALAFAVGAPIHEANPVVLSLIARQGLLVVLLVKFAAVVGWLALDLGVWLVCVRNRWRVGTLSATGATLGAALFSAWVFWWNIAAVFFGR